MLTRSMLVLEQNGADPHVGRALLRRDPEVLGRAHREVGQPVLPGELPQPGKPGPGLLRVCRCGWHRGEPADAEREVTVDLAGLHPTLRSLACEVDLEEPRH